MPPNDPRQRPALERDLPANAVPGGEIRRVRERWLVLFGDVFVVFVVLQGAHSHAPGETEGGPHVTDEASPKRYAGDIAGLMCNRSDLR